MSEEDKQKVEETIKRINPRVLAAISGNTGSGFLALSVAICSTTIALAKFRAAYEGRSQAVSG